MASSSHASVGTARTRTRVSTKGTSDAGSSGSRVQAQADTIRVDANGDAAGWVFGVPTVFLRAAMGFKAAKDQTGHGRPVLVWKRKLPVLRTFKRGDVFYEPPAARHLVWKDALRQLRGSVQIVSANPDHYGTRGAKLEAGQVEFTMTSYERGVARMTTKRRATQQAFEEFLRTGRAP